MATLKPKAKDPSSSNFKTSAWVEQAPAWQITYDLWQSPLYVQEQGQTYLRKFRFENPEKYQERLKQSVPRNTFREYIETMAGMAFKDDPAPRGAPKPLAALFTDFDGEGNSLHSFLLNSFEKFLRDGGGAFFVTSTMSEKATEKASAGLPLTAADRIEDRPVAVFIEARQIINSRSEKINGIDTLTQVTIEVDELDPVGEFGEEAVLRHYILRPGSFDVERWDKKTKAFVPEPEKSGETGLDYIPLVLLAPLGTAPSLLILAMLTIQYYNKISDFDDWCHNACVPERVYNFQAKEDADVFLDQIKNSASTARLMWGEHTKAYFNEVEGKGMDIVIRRIDALSAEMAALGIGMLAPTEVVQKSATEVMDTAGRRQSRLARFAREFENAVEKMLYIMADVMKVIGGSAAIDMSDAETTSLKLLMDFDRLTFSPDQMLIFDSMRKNGDLSQQTFLEIIAKRVDMPDGWTVEEEVARLAKEPPVEPNPAPIDQGKMKADKAMVA